MIQPRFVTFTVRYDFWNYCVRREWRIVYLNRVLCAGVVALMTFGSIRVASAQMDFSGEWQPVRNQDNTENPLVRETGWAFR